MKTIGKSPKYKPYKPKPHPRSDDITKAQPPITKGIQAIGVGLENINTRKRRER